MGKVYKNKKSSGCALCKPHKHGWSPKEKSIVRVKEREMDKDIMEIDQLFSTCCICGKKFLGDIPDDHIHTTEECLKNCEELQY